MKASKRLVRKRPSGIPASVLPRQGVSDATSLLRSSVPADQANRLSVQPPMAPTVTGRPLRMTKNQAAVRRAMVRKQASAVKQQAVAAKVQRQAALRQQVSDQKSALMAQKAQARQELLADRSALRQSVPEAKLAVIRAKQAKSVAIVQAKSSVAQAQQAKKQAIILAQQALATGKLSAKQALMVDKTLAARDLAVRKAKAKADYVVGTMAAKQQRAEARLATSAPRKQKNAPGAHKREAIRQAARRATGSPVIGGDQAFEPDPLMPDMNSQSPDIEVSNDQSFEPEQTFEPDQGFEDQQQMTEESPVMDDEYTGESPVLEDGYVEEGSSVEEDGYVEEGDEVLPSDEEFTGETQPDDLNSEQYVMDAFSGLVTDYGTMDCSCDEQMSGYLDSYAGRGRGAHNAKRAASRQLAMRYNRPPSRRVKQMSGYLDGLDTFAAFADAPVAVPSPTAPPATGVLGFIKEAANTYITVKNQAVADKAASKRQAVVEKTKLVQAKATQNKMKSQATASTGLLALGAMAGVAAIFLMVSKSKL